MGKRLFQTIRFRLTLWNAVVVLVASLLAMLAVRETMRLTIENEAKSLLREEALELELAIRQLHPDQSRIDGEFERKVLGHEVHGWFASLSENDATSIWKSKNFPLEALPEFEENSAEGYSIVQTNKQLIVRHQFELAIQKPYTIVIGEPTEYIKNDVWQLTKIMLGIGAIMLIVAPAIGYWLSGRAISPVSEIIATTRSLNPNHLESRLRIRGTGDELDQISHEINSFVNQIARHINNQRVFVANAAHELRSPITAIQTSVDVTLNKQRTVTEYQEELETVSEQCQQLRHLVNQLLELAETDAGSERQSFSPVNFTALIEKSVIVFTGVAEEKGVDFNLQLQPNVIIHGDEVKLRQVVNNLLDNALKFSSTDGHVTIELSQDIRETKFTVCDTGRGVAEENLERIFDRFFQVDQSRQRDVRRGNGLGLSICQSIVELHNGRISAANTTLGFAIVSRFPVATTNRE